MTDTVDADAKLTPKMENFIAAYFETGNASEAYRRAYDAENMKPETIHVRACELMQNGKVAARVKMIRAKAVERAAVTVQSILDELEQARLLALSIEQPSAMVAASMGRAKIAGLVVDKREEGAPGDFSKLSDEELLAQARQEAIDLGLIEEPAAEESK